MAGFTTFDDIVSEVTANGKLAEWHGYKTGPTAEAAGVMTRLWTSAGLPGAGSEQAALIVITAGDRTGVGGRIKLTITSNTVYATGDTVVISGSTGSGTFTTDSNGSFTITRNSATEIELNGTTSGSGTWTSGGVIYKTVSYDSANASANGGITFTNQSPDTKHLLTFGGTCSQDAVLFLYDRLVMTSGINIATTGNKTVTSLTLPRYSGTDSVVVEPWIEINTTVTANTPIVTLSSYTNDSGGTSTTAASTTLAATPVASSTFPLPLVAGDKGVRAVETLNVGTAGTSGIANVVLRRRLAAIPIQMNQWNERDFVTQLTALTRIYDGACLELMYLATTTTAITTTFSCRFAYG